MIWLSDTRLSHQPIHKNSGVCKCSSLLENQDRWILFPRPRLHCRLITFRKKCMNFYFSQRYYRTSKKSESQQLFTVTQFFRLFLQFIILTAKKAYQPNIVRPPTIDRRKNKCINDSGYQIFQGRGLLEFWYCLVYDQVISCSQCNSLSTGG